MLNRIAWTAQRRIAGAAQRRIDQPGGALLGLALCFLLVLAACGGPSVTGYYSRPPQTKLPPDSKVKIRMDGDSAYSSYAEQEVNSVINFIDERFGVVAVADSDSVTPLVLSVRLNRCEAKVTRTATIRSCTRSRRSGRRTITQSYPCPAFRTEQHLMCAMGFKLEDAGNKVILARNFDENDTWSETGGLIYPEPPPPEQGLHPLIKKMTRNFGRLISPRRFALEFELKTPDLASVEAGNVFAENGKWAEAQERYQRALNANPNLDAETRREVIYNLAIASVFVGATEEGLEYAKQLANEDPQYVEFSIRLEKVQQQGPS